MAEQIPLNLRMDSNILLLHNNNMARRPQVNIPRKEATNKVIVLLLCNHHWEPRLHSKAMGNHNSALLPQVHHQEIISKATERLLPSNTVLLLLSKAITALLPRKATVPRNNTFSLHLHPWVTGHHSRLLGMELQMQKLCGKP
jgi:hypothetical protein